MEEKRKNDDRITALEYGQENLDKCVTSVETKLDKILTNHLPHIQDGITDMGDKIIKEMKTSYVSKDRFSPIEKLVYGMSGVILTGVVVAILALVIK